MLAALCPTFGSLFLILSFGGWEAFAVPSNHVPFWAVCAFIGMLLGAGAI